jgi:hypothetical protein
MSAIRRFDVLRPIVRRDEIVAPLPNPLASALPAKAVSASFVVRVDASHGLRRIAPFKMEGNDRSRLVLGLRSTADRLGGRVVPRCPAPSQIKDTLAGYRTAELSDSPRASFMPPVPAFDRVVTKGPGLRFARVEPHDRV